MKFISIDEEGFPHFDGIRMSDQEIGAALIRSLKPAPLNAGFQAELGGQLMTVEAFDFPWVIQGVALNPAGEGQISITLPYQVERTLLISDLRIDEWDRFVGADSKSNIPFVLSRKAQAQLFELCEAYDDESITIQGTQVSILPQYQTIIPIQNADFWDEKYLSAQEPGWELNTHHPSLPHIVSNLKLCKSRILVLGCGTGNDAAYFAGLGHIVTAVDFSAHALEKARQKYSRLSSITWIQGDIFDSKLPVPNDSYDIVFEHTCFCAISPEKRNELIQLWGKKLHDRGHFLGIFFNMWRTEHPPFGATEWEIRKRFGQKFTPLYWQRLKPPLALLNRLGIELLVYARVAPRG